MSTSKHFVPILATRRESHLSVCVSLDHLDKAYIEYTEIGPRPSGCIVSLVKCWKQEHRKV